MTTRATKKTITQMKRTKNMLNMRSDFEYVVFINSNVNYENMLISQRDDLRVD
jgi:hypothetical protein